MISTHDDLTEWQGMGETWQQTAGEAIDVAALQRTIEQRSRRLRMAVITDLAVAGVALSLCLWSLFARTLSTWAVAGHLALITLLLVWTGWGLWQRRRQWWTVDQSPDALLDFERSRIRTSLRLARVSIWLALALCLALFVIVVAVPNSGWPGSQPGQAPGYLSLWSTFAVTVMSALIAAIRSYRLRQRGRHMDALKASLQDSH